MKSQQRVSVAINHKIPDRIPLDLGSMYKTSISKSAYINLRKRASNVCDKEYLLVTGASPGI